MAKAKSETAADRRVRWAAQAAKEREARKAPEEARLAWLQRPAIKARMAPATWEAQAAACQAALGTGKRTAKARAKAR